MQISTMAAFSGVSTLVTIIIGAVFRDERLYYFHFIGLSLIILRMVGVSCISIMRDKKREKANAEIASVAEKTEYIKK